MRSPSQTPSPPATPSAASVATNFTPITGTAHVADETLSSMSTHAPPISLLWRPDEIDAESTFDRDSFALGLEAASSDYDSGEFSLENYDLEVSSIIMRHEFENGRRFHKFRHGRYPLPNDDAEQERDSWKHALQLEVTDGLLFHAPLTRDPCRIIDLGCGTGRWAMDVAEAYPSAEVIGVDLSPIMPEWLPPNLRFMVDDIEDEQWLHGGNFDLVYLRHVAVMLRHPDVVLKNAFNHLAPGGFVECTEFHGFLECDDGTMPEDQAAKRFMELIKEAMKTFGHRWTIGSQMKPLIEEAGFVNVQHRVYNVPLGCWAKSPRHRLVGLYLQEILQALFESVKPRALTRLGIPPDELEDLTARGIAGLHDRRCHAYLGLSMYTGQKPAN